MKSSNLKSLEYSAPMILTAVSSLKIVATKIARKSNQFYPVYLAVKNSC